MKTKNILLLVILGLSFNTGLMAAGKSKHKMKNQIKQVTSKKLMSDLREFVYSGKPNRFFGTAGHKLSKSFLLNKVKLSEINGAAVIINKALPNINLGLKLYQTDFDRKVKNKYAAGSQEYIKWDTFTRYMKTTLQQYKTYNIENIIWYKKGRTDKTLVVNAHYDTSVQNMENFRINKQGAMPGADYNASGVTIALNIIDVLKNFDLENSIMICFSDFQSLGFLGAHELGTFLKDKNITGVVNLEMLGHDSKFYDKNKKHFNMKVYSRPNESDRNIVNLFSKANQRNGLAIKFKHMENSFENSDSFRFWELGIPSVTYTQDWEDDFNTKRYQTTNDIPEGINQRTLQQSFKYISYGVMNFALNL